MTNLQRVEQGINAIRALANGHPQPHLRDRAQDVLRRLLPEFEPPVLPSTIFAAELATSDDYRANWNHQLWYHLEELVRIHDGRKQRAAFQGEDDWVHIAAPTPEEALNSHFREIVKLRSLIDRTPSLISSRGDKVLFEDLLLDKPDVWEHPPGLAVERDAQRGVRWTGQNPGGDWFWLHRAFSMDNICFEVDLHPLSTIKGGLILGFCVQPHTGVAFSRASGPSMRNDYYTNFESYHFSVHRGSTGYCNLRRCGPGMVMLASFDDPCRELNRWYRLQIVKAGAQVELRVDDRLVCCYLDLGYIQPRLDSGYFGLRHFQGFDGWQRNLRVGELSDSESCLNSLSSEWSKT